MERSKVVSLRLDFQGRSNEDEVPTLAAYLLDRSGRVVEKIGQLKEGRIDIDSEKLIDPCCSLAFGPDMEPKDTHKQNMIRYRIADYQPKWAAKPGAEFTINVNRDSWEKLHVAKVCVSGHVRKCWLLLRPWLQYKSKKPGACLPAQKCQPICRGLVEVWMRECCKTPLGIGDGPLQDICKQFPLLCEAIPDLCKKYPHLCHPEHEFDPRIPHEPDPCPACHEFKFPDPGYDFGRSGLGGGSNPRETMPPTMDPGIRYSIAAGLPMPSPRLMTYIESDVRTLVNLSGKELVDFVMDSPRLWDYFYHCHSKKLGETHMEIDGRFAFCWRDFPMQRLSNCKRTCFYKVKQWIDGAWVYIYDGSAEGEYFKYNEVAEIVTMAGRACGEEDDSEFPKPFVKLEEIGTTPTYNLFSYWKGYNHFNNHDLTQISEDSMAVPLPNSGLANPPDPVGASGYNYVDLINQPWGSTLLLRLKFHHGMRENPIHAKYYRISMAQADASGHPMAGTLRVLKTPVSWRYDNFVNGEWTNKYKFLGPTALEDPDHNPIDGLFEIPYAADALWDANQFHGIWHTAEQENNIPKWANDRYLIYVEIFDAQGIRLSPLSGHWVFLRRLNASGSEHMAEVPFNKLAHMIWIDNLPVFGDIFDFRTNHNPNTAQCQFLQATGTSLFSVGFKAFHTRLKSGTPPETFLWRSRLYYVRGLNGTPTNIETNTHDKPVSCDYNEVAESAALTFSSMLGSFARCSFTIALEVQAKHTNGFDRIEAYDYFEQAAVALELDNEADTGAAETTR